MSDQLSTGERIYPPLPAAVLSGLILALFVSLVQRGAADRRTAHEIRHELISDMTLATSRLYMGLQEYWRVLGKPKPSEAGPNGFKQPALTPELEAARRALKESYIESRIEGESLEQRLEIYLPLRAQVAAN